MKQKAQTIYDKMRADCVQPHSMSGIWTEDVEKDPEWLVIYASEHMDDKGNIQRDGFNVSSYQLLPFCFY